MPLQDIFWLILMIAGFTLAVWLVLVVLRDVFGRDDLSAGAKMAWTVLAIFFPIGGGLIYLVSQGASPETLKARAARRNDELIYR